jgi:hypothetical protein
MSSVEIIAWIFIIFVAIKMLVLLVNPRIWMNFAKSVWSNTNTVKLLGCILAAVVLYFLLQEITIVQVIAVTAFIALLLIVGLASEVPYFIKKYEAQIKRGNLWRDYWFYTLIWIVLLVWALKELLTT